MRTPQGLSQPSGLKPAPGDEVVPAGECLGRGCRCGFPMPEGCSVGEYHRKIPAAGRMCGPRMEVTLWLPRVACELVEKGSEES